METLFQRNIDLYFIKDVDEKKKRIYLENCFCEKKRVYICTSDEVGFYKDIFNKALNASLFLSVQYDEDYGVIIQN